MNKLKEFKRPQQSLEVNKEWINNIKDNIKRITIREGLRDFSKGKVIIFNTEKEWCTVRNIIDIQCKPLSDVSDSIAQEDGFKDIEDLYCKLKDYYPNITMKSEVTIIRWS